MSVQFEIAGGTVAEALSEARGPQDDTTLIAIRGKKHA